MNSEASCSIPKRAVVYARCSTSDKNQKPEAQVQVLRAFAANRGWSVADVIIDNGYSGKNDRRPGLTRLLTLVRTRQVDVVLVTKFDRFARSLKHLIVLLEELRDLDVSFVSTGDQVDFTTASGRLMFHLLAAFGEFELSLVRERTLTGLAYAKARGKKLGRPRNNNYEAILSLRQRGLTYTQIQTQLKCDRSAIYRALRAMAKTRSRTEFQMAEKTRHKKAV